MHRVIFFITLIFCPFLSAKDPLIIAIAGGTGSGKTMLAEQILNLFSEEAVLISQDSYYNDLAHLSLEERAQVNFDHPAALDFDLLKNHLAELKENRSVSVPVYNFHTHCRESLSVNVDAASIIIVEGILLFAVPEIRELCDIKVFVDAAEDIRLLRRIERDIRERSRDLKGIRDQYLKTVRPMHAAFVEPSKNFADLIIPSEDYNPTALKLIVSILHSHLRQN